MPQNDDTLSDSMTPSGWKTIENVVLDWNLREESNQSVNGLNDHISRRHTRYQAWCDGVRKIVRCCIMLCVATIGATIPLHAQQSAASSVAALSVKVAAMEKTLSESGEGLVIYVANAPDVARELRKLVGQQVGKSRIAVIQEGTTLPTSRPDIVFIGSPEIAPKFVKYARLNRTLSVCSRTDVAEYGVTLCLGTDEVAGKPSIVLNATGSREESMEWNPALFRIARTTR